MRTWRSTLSACTRKRSKKAADKCRVSVIRRPPERTSAKFTDTSASKAAVVRLPFDTLGGFAAKCEELARAPIMMGRPRPELRSDLRSHPFEAYVIFFRYVGDVLEVVNVLEGHRDIEAFFDDKG